MRQVLHPADLLRAHQARAFEHGEVLHDGRKTHRQRPRQLADRGRPLRQPRDDGAPRRVGEGLKGEIERV